MSASPTLSDEEYVAKLEADIARFTVEGMRLVNAHAARLREDATSLLERVLRARESEAKTNAITQILQQTPQLEDALRRLTQCRMQLDVAKRQLDDIHWEGAATRPPPLSMGADSKSNLSDAVITGVDGASASSIILASLKSQLEENIASEGAKLQALRAAAAVRTQYLLERREAMRLARLAENANARSSLQRRETAERSEQVREAGRAVVDIIEAIRKQCIDLRSLRCVKREKMAQEIETLKQRARVIRETEAAPLRDKMLALEQDLVVQQTELHARQTAEKKHVEEFEIELANYQIASKLVQADLEALGASSSGNSDPPAAGNDHAAAISRPDAVTSASTRGGHAPAAPTAVSASSSSLHPVALQDLMSELQWLLTQRDALHVASMSSEADEGTLAQYVEVASYEDHLRKCRHRRELDHDEGEND